MDGCVRVYVCVFAVGRVIGQRGCVSDTKYENMVQNLDCLTFKGFNHVEGH